MAYVHTPWARRPGAYTIWSLKPLPRRIPGAALEAAPAPSVVELHTTDPRLYTRFKFVFKLWMRFVKWFQAWLFEPDGDFAEWWCDTATNDRKRRHVGRHRLDDHPEQKKRWVDWPTQWWPTLATSSNSREVITESVVFHMHMIPTGGRMVCTSLHNCVTQPATFQITLRPGYVRRQLATI